MKQPTELESVFVCFSFMYVASRMGCEIMFHGCLEDSGILPDEESRDADVIFGGGGNV